MSPKESAIYLANKFVTKSIFDMSNEELNKERLSAKRNALICIDEQSNLCRRFQEKYIEFVGEVDFLNAVRIEIEKL